MADTGRLIAAGLLLAVLAAGCTRSDGAADGDAAATARGMDDGLPRPEGAPGASVTGMPTSPPLPPAPGVDGGALASAATVAPLPVDTGGELVAADPGTTNAGDVPPPGEGTPPFPPVPPVPPPPPAAPAPAAAPDPAGAAAVVRDYVGALASGSADRARQSWNGTPTDSAVASLARGAAFSASVLAPAVVSGSDGTAAISVPVEVRGAGADGGQQRVTATYTVRRGSDGQWRITGAAVRDAGP